MKLTLTLLLLGLALCLHGTPARAQTTKEPVDLEAVFDMPGNRRASASAANQTSDDSSARAVSSERSTGSLVVSAAQVCSVQRALWGRPAWSAQRCRDVAAALNVLPEPLTMLAVAANESNMRADAIRHAGPGVFDLGLMGVRCRVVDGKCTNGAARGYTVAQLLDPLVNVRVAHVLATLKGPRWLHRWNGSPGYAARIAVLAAAIAGEPVEATGTGAKWARIRAMVARIVRAMDDERKS